MLDVFIRLCSLRKNIENEIVVIRSHSTANLRGFVERKKRRMEDRESNDLKLNIKTREISLKIFFVLHSSDSIVVVTSVLGRNHAKYRRKDNLLYFRRSRRATNHDLMIFQDSDVYNFVLMILISCSEAI